MSVRHCVRLLHIAVFALAGAPAVAANAPHNVILILTESLPAASVDRSSAPTLARFRDEGVNFINSHAALPTATGSQLTPESLLEVAAVAQSEDGSRRYSMALLSEPEDSALETTIKELGRANRPFLLVYRTGGHVTTSSNMHAAEHALTAIEATLKAADLYESTNIIVSAERGAAATVWKESETSISLDTPYPDVPKGQLPPGFLAIDLIAALQSRDPTLSLFDPDQENDTVDWGGGEHPSLGNGVIAVHPSLPQVRIVAHGGYDLIYMPAEVSRRNVRWMGSRIVESLLAHDYVSGIFIDEKRLGHMRGALPIRDIGLDGTGGTALPAVVVSFASVSIGCDRPTLCTTMIADTPLAEGQEIEGGFSRAHTWSFMAARGPDFWVRTVTRAPASNADVVRTMAELLRLETPSGKLHARVLTESLRSHDWKAAQRVQERTIVSTASAGGMQTVVQLQMVGSTKYFDAAGFPGWTVGIEEQDGHIEEGRAHWNWPRPSSLTIQISPN